MSPVISALMADLDRWRLLGDGRRDHENAGQQHQE